MNAFSHKERLKCFVQTALAEGDVFEQTVDVTTPQADVPTQEFAPTDSVNKNESAVQQYFLRLKQQASESDRNSRADYEAAEKSQRKFFCTADASGRETVKQYGEVITSNSNGAIII